MTVKEEKFCEYYIELGSGSEAYRKAYNKPNLEPSQASTRAYELLQNSYIAEHIEELKESLRNDNKISQQKIIDYHMEIVDWYRELKELARQKNLSKEDKARVYMLKDLIKGSDYRGSLDSITKMLGLNAPEKHEHEVKKITIEEKKRET
jgi:phage terminase small subunit